MPVHGDDGKREKDIEIETGRSGTGATPNKTMIIKDDRQWVRCLPASQPPMMTVQPANKCIQPGGGR